MREFEIKLTWHGSFFSATLYDTNKPPSKGFFGIDSGVYLVSTDSPNFFDADKARPYKERSRHKIEQLLSSLESKVKPPCCPCCGSFVNCLDFSWQWLFNLAIGCAGGEEMDMEFEHEEPMEKLEEGGFDCIDSGDGKGTSAGEGSIFLAGPFPYNDADDIISKLREILRQIDPNYDDESCCNRRAFCCF